MKTLNLSLLFILLFSFLSCKTQNISLKKAQIEQSKNDYIVYLNDFTKQINLDSTYLDKKNIRKITLNENYLMILQKNTASDLLKLDEIKLEKVNKFVLNGDLLNQNDLKNIQLEPTVIKSISILKSNDLHQGPGLDNKLDKTLIIETK